MQKLSNLEKRETFAGFAKKDNTTKITKAQKAKRLDRFNNFSLFSVSCIPSLITLGEGIYDLCASKKTVNRYSSDYKRYKGKPYGYNNYSDYRRDYFSYSSHAIRPTLRFTSTGKPSISFGVPWFS